MCVMQGCVKFPVNQSLLLLRKGGVRHTVAGTVPDKTRLHERLLRLLRALGLQRVLQQLGYDVPGWSLLLRANRCLHFLQQDQIFTFYLAELGF